MTVKEDLQIVLNKRLKSNLEDLSLLLDSGSHKVWLYRYDGLYSWILDLPDFFNNIAIHLNTNDVILLLHRVTNYKNYNTVALLVYKVNGKVKISEYRDLAYDSKNKVNQTLSDPFNLIEVATVKEDTAKPGYVESAYNNATSAVNSTIESVSSAFNSTKEYFFGNSSDNTRNKSENTDTTDN